MPMCKECRLVRQQKSRPLVDALESGGELEIVAEAKEAVGRMPDLIGQIDRSTVLLSSSMRLVDPPNADQALLTGSELIWRVWFNFQLKSLKLNCMRVN
jgi:hypothetical protein